MTSEVLWRQIEAPSFDERLEPVERIENTLTASEGGDQLTSRQFRALLDQRDTAIRDDPEGNLDAVVAIADLEAKYA
jgi:hypothetical protein